MKFKKLRLHGFKSFADPAELLFDDGLTGIVGPNGCGKSNLLEALRWVMGESRAKTVRGEGMEDVIFAGSEKRSPRSFAEVTLTVDNQSRSAPEKFNDHDEIEISRKIVREHGSVYRINGREVRARDLQAMFADASTGSASPALVRQGQINELIQAKPKQRKKIIEDAAGVGGLYARRREAEDGLEAATRNLETVDEMFRHNEQRIAVLRKQAEKAKKYREVTKKIRELEVKRIEILYFKAKIEKNRSEQEANEAVMRALKAEKARNAAFLTEEEANRNFEPVKRELSVATAILRGKESEAAQKKQEAEQALLQSEHLQNHLEILKKEAFREAEILADARREHGKYQNAHMQALAEETAYSPESQAETEQKILFLREEIKQTETELEVLRDKISADHARREQARKMIAQLKTDCSRLEAEFLKASEEENFLKKKIESDYDLVPLQNEINQLTDKLKNAGESAGRIEQEKLSAQNRLEQSKEKYEAVRREMMTVETEMKGLTALTGKNVANQRAAENLAKITVQPGYEKAFAAALRDGAEYDDQANAAKYWVAAPVNTVNFSPEIKKLSEVTQAPPYLQSALSAVGIITDEAFVAAPLPPPGCFYVTPAGKVKRYDGFVEAAPDHQKTAVMLEQKNRLQALQAKLYEMKEWVIRAEGVTAQDQSEVNRLTQELQKYKRETEETRNALLKIEKNLHEKEKEFAAINAKLNAATEKKNAYGIDASAALSRLQTVSAQIEENPESATDQNALEAFKEKLSADREILRTLYAQIEQVKLQEKQRKQTLERLEKEVKEWESRVRLSEKRSAETKERIEKIQKEAEILAPLPEKLTGEYEILAQTVKSATERLKQARRSFEEAENGLFAMKKQTADLQAEIANANEDKARKETRWQAVQEKFAVLLDQIREMADTHQLDPLRFEQIDPEIEKTDIQRLEEELRESVRAKENIGAVNLLAESELSQAEAETGGLLYEKNDLSSAINKLQAVIKQLNDEGREKILKAFHSVNEKFQFLFQSLFSGGEAGLELVESDDPLEAGLEISAMPPGKKTKSLSLLSGGEQALTCTALIFAVFLTGPAPVCVLDEVDAPLDDANTERFCRLIREMTHLTETRFIVITHRPLTMANADRLFGVTMAEKGVSALVSVDLAVAERLILA